MLLNIKTEGLGLGVREGNAIIYLKFFNIIWLFE